jgi:microcystin-dependent protein
MSNPFIAEIRIFAGNFAPRGWAFCNGQILPISQNTALFSLLGTTYGGDGRTNFALPNLQGRFPMHPGQGPGLSLRSLGEINGSEAVTLTINELPAHAHALNAAADATSVVPTGLLPGTPASAKIYGGTSNPTTLAGAAVGASGGSQPHNNMQPYLTLNFIIALQGVFPPRA